jgi:hypothetical protein
VQSVALGVALSAIPTTLGPRHRLLTPGGE